MILRKEWQIDDFILEVIKAWLTDDAQFTPSDFKFDMNNELLSGDLLLSDRFNLLPKKRYTCVSNLLSIAAWWCKESREKSYNRENEY